MRLARREFLEINQSYSDYAKFLFTEIEIRVCSAPSCSLQEGRFAIVTKRWERDAVDASCRKTNGSFAYGKTVWSWRPDAGVKSAMMLRIMPMMGARKPGPQGELGISRKATAQGMPDCLRFTCMLVCVSFVALFAHETAGAACTRHPLRPPFLRAGNAAQSSGEIRREKADGCFGERRCRMELSAQRL